MVPLMTNPTSRMLSLLSLLQTHRHWSGTKLARRLNVTTRTIRRDVDRLRELGYPVAAAAGADGGYRLEAGRELPPLLLDDEEAVAIAVGLRTAATVTVRSAAGPLSRTGWSRRDGGGTWSRGTVTARPGGPSASTGWSSCNPRRCVSANGPCPRATQRRSWPKAIRTPFSKHQAVLRLHAPAAALLRTATDSLEWLTMYVGVLDVDFEIVDPPGARRLHPGDRRLPAP